jgi:hypothetical protein
VKLPTKETNRTESQTMQRRLDCNIETVTTVRRRADPGEGLGT